MGVPSVRFATPQTSAETQPRRSIDQFGRVWKIGDLAALAGREAQFQVGEGDFELRDRYVALADLDNGERGTIMVIAADRRQARTIYRYVGAMLRVPLLAALVQRQTEDTIDLTNGVTIEIAVASYKSVRGYTLIAALCDELAFWRVDEGSSNPDAEIIAALRPAMATVPGALLLCASSAAYVLGLAGGAGRYLRWQPDRGDAAGRVPGLRPCSPPDRCCYGRLGLLPAL
jgi:hypothetical protein